VTFAEYLAARGMAVGKWIPTSYNPAVKYFVPATTEDQNAVVREYMEQSNASKSTKAT
jgi:hypothetical protein